jgi:hypothetical protein
MIAGPIDLGPTTRSLFTDVGPLLNEGPMWSQQTISLTQKFGPERTAQLAVVYGEVLALASKGQVSRFLPRGVRLAVATALLGEAERGEHDPARLKAAVLSALERDPDWKPSDLA